jgi:hypothetical protein
VALATNAPSISPGNVTTETPTVIPVSTKPPTGSPSATASSQPSTIFPTNQATSEVETNNTGTISPSVGNNNTGPDVNDKKNNTEKRDETEFGSSSTLKALPPAWLLLFYPIVSSSLF